MNKRIAILASGVGSNAQCITEYFRENGGAEVVLFLSNNATALALQRAHLLGVDSFVFNKEELEDLFGFQNELGINLNSIDIDTFKLINRTDTEYCTSVIYEYDFDLKLIGSFGLKGKIVNHSIMLWTENGWLFLTDTQEI